jgi:hypothetical protein
MAEGRQPMLVGRQTIKRQRIGRQTWYRMWTSDKQICGRKSSNRKTTDSKAFGRKTCGGKNSDRKTVKLLKDIDIHAAEREQRQKMQTERRKAGTRYF